MTPHEQAAREAVGQAWVAWGQRNGWTPETEVFNPSEWEPFVEVFAAVLAKKDAAAREYARNASGATAGQFVSALKAVFPGLVPPNRWTQTWPPEPPLQQVREEMERQFASNAAELATLRAREAELSTRVAEADGDLAVFRAANLVCGQSATTLSLGMAPTRTQGCGQSITSSPDVYRCVDCQVPFHRACLGRHCADEIAESRAREALAEARDLLGNVYKYGAAFGSSEWSEVSYYLARQRDVVAGPRDPEGRT